MHRAYSNLNGFIIRSFDSYGDGSDSGYFGDGPMEDPSKTEILSFYRGDGLVDYDDRYDGLMDYIEFIEANA